MDVQQRIFSIELGKKICKKCFFFLPLESMVEIYVQDKNSPCIQQWIDLLQDEYPICYYSIILQFGLSISEIVFPHENNQKKMFSWLRLRFSNILVMMSSRSENINNIFFRRRLHLKEVAT